MKLEKTSYVKNEKEYTAYIVKGTLRGKDVQASIVPTDFGGYALLDILFGDNDSIDIRKEPFSFKDETTGNMITGINYIASMTDEDGETFECKVKPNRNSDKALLAMLMK